MDRDDRLSLVLCSGTDDRLTGAAVLVVGAAAMERKVEILLQYWALDAFRADRITKDHGLSPEAGTDGQTLWEWHDGHALERDAPAGERDRRRARSTRARSRWRC